MKTFDKLAFNSLQLSTPTDGWRLEENRDPIAYGVSMNVPLVFFESYNAKKDMNVIMSKTPCGKIIFPGTYAVELGIPYVCRLVQKPNVAFLDGFDGEQRDSHYWECVGSARRVIAVKHLVAAFNMDMKDAIEQYDKDKHWYSPIAEWLVDNEFLERIVITTTTGAVVVPTPFNAPKIVQKGLSQKQKRVNYMSDLEKENKDLNAKVNNLNLEREGLIESYNREQDWCNDYKSKAERYLRQRNRERNHLAQVSDAHEITEKELEVALQTLINMQNVPVKSSIDIWELIACNPTTPKKEILAALRIAQFAYHPDRVMQAGKLIQDYAKEIIIELNLFKSTI